MADNSYWIETAPSKSDYFPLNKNIKVDVAIIGGGITGITTAYLLSKSGKKVALLDKSSLYSGETSYTTAFLTSYPDTELEGIKHKWNIEKVKWVLKSGEEAINLVEKISKDENIECYFKRVPVFIYTQDGIDFLKSESEVAKEAGFDFEFKNDSELPMKNSGYLEVPNQAKFHPLKYLKGLSEVIAKNDVQIFESTLVENIDQGIVTTDKGHTVTADYIVMATHNTFGGPLIVQSELEPYNTYVLCVEVEGQNLPGNLYWDTEDPYHYIRAEGKILMIGGADHKTGELVEKAEDKYNELERYLNSAFPDLKYKVKLRWSGQVIETNDGLPYIGFLPEKKNVLVATGFAGNGIAYGTISGRIITDLINEKENELTDLYTLKRLKGVGELLKKGSEIIKEYGRKYFGKFEAFDEYTLENDSGKVCEDHAKKIAVYKDKDGKVTKLSAVCTHLGCIVNWNDDQKSWDCPCHGSRYLNDGTVMGGPATKPLEKL